VLASLVVPLIILAVAVPDRRGRFVHQQPIARATQRLTAILMAYCCWLAVRLGLGAASPRYRRVTWISFPSCVMAVAASVPFWWNLSVGAYLPPRRAAGVRHLRF
jgi:hypothetical protein